MPYYWLDKYRSDDKFVALGIMLWTSTTLNAASNLVFAHFFRSARPPAEIPCRPSR